MDRRFLYPGTFDDVHDDLQIEQNVLLALGAQALSLLGNNNNPQSSTYPTVLAGFIPTVAGLVATFGPGAVYAQQAVDATAFGVVAANSQNTYQQGLSAGFQYSVTVPGTGGQSRNDLIQFFTKQLDTDLVVMPYFNANQPSVPFSGPNNSNNPNYQNRRQVVQIAITLGVAATTGTQTTPAGTAGFLLNYGVTNCTTPLTPPVSAPTLAPTAGGSIPAGSYRAVITYSNAQGETTASPESTTLTTVSTGSIVVTGGAVPAGATQVNVYLYPTGTSSSGSEVYASNYNGGTSTTLTALPAVGAVAYPQLTNFVGGYVVTSANGQSALTLGNITTPTNAPWLAGLNQQHHLGLPGTAPKINLGTEIQGPFVGSQNFTPVGVPSAPTCYVIGTPGTGTPQYALVAIDSNGQKSLPSAFTALTTAPNTLSASAYVSIPLPRVPGVVAYDILKNDTGHSIALNQAVGTTFNDQGGATAAYLVPLSDTTGEPRYKQRSVFDSMGYAAGRLPWLNAYSSVLSLPKRAMVGGYVSPTPGNTVEHCAADSSYLYVVGQPTGPGSAALYVYELATGRLVTTVTSLIASLTVFQSSGIRADGTYVWLNLGQTLLFRVTVGTWAITQFATTSGTMTGSPVLDQYSGLLFITSSAGSTLYSINPNTGVVTPYSYSAAVGSSTTSCGGLVSDGNGRLYFLCAGYFVRFTVTGSTFTAVASTVGPQSGAFDGSFYYYLANGNTANSYKIDVLNFATGGIITMGTGIVAVSWDCAEFDGHRIWTGISGGQIIAIDPNIKNITYITRDVSVAGNTTPAFKCAFDGTHMWVPGGTDGNVYRLIP